MRLVRLFLAAVLVTLLAACAQVLGPQSISYSANDLNAMLDKRFPLDRRLAEVLDIRISRPTVSLVPERNHLATRLTMEGADRLFGSRFTGALALEYGVRYEASDQTLRLVDVHVTELHWNEAVSSGRGVIQRFGGAAVEQMLEDTVIHKLTPEQLERAARYGYQPSAAQVTLRGLEITLVPRP